MDLIPHELVKKINKGRCFILIGSGPSCEIGYPSWHKLAESTFHWLKDNGKEIDVKSYQAYLDAKKYPELFQQAELDIGSRQELIELLKSYLIPQTRQHGVIYDILTKWPFACYITTNYDDELYEYLKKNGVYFSVVQNRAEDFSWVRDGASHIIQKLHSDLNFPNAVVLTSSDYRKLYVTDENRYFPHKIQQMFEIYDLLIIGHSLSDHDIKNILQLAREKSSLLHPIYMIAPNCTPAEKREYKENYNIILLSYEDQNGTHEALQRMLCVTSKYVSYREKISPQMPGRRIPPEEVQAAMSLFLFRKTQPIGTAENIVPLILVALADVKEPGIAIDELINKAPLRTISRKSVDTVDWIQKSLETLIQNKMIGTHSDKYWITEDGQNKVQENKALRDVEKDQAYGQFILDLIKECPGLTKEFENQCQQLAEKVLVDTFASRGLTVANKVFAGRSARSDELSDIFKCTSQAASSLTDYGVKAAFLGAMYSFIVTPTIPQKKYLASLAQGYFLFHLLGLDPTCAKLRWEIFKNTLWICDASVLLPIIATGCYNFDYATKLFGMLSRAQAVLVTTPNLLQEAWIHFEWAVTHVKRYGVDSPEFLNAALAKDEYRQNLFLDGYIRLSAEGKIGSFSDYIKLICPDEFTQSSFENNITQKGITVLNFSNLKGFVQEKWYGEVEEYKAQIEKKRKESGTWHNELQVESEAEVLELIKNIRSGEMALSDVEIVLAKCYFVSQGRFLDSMTEDVLITWTPEAMYRYLSSFPDEILDPELFQQCMLYEYFNAGIFFIDKERYLRFFGPSIDASKSTYQEEKGQYIKYVEEIPSQALDEAFEKTPDLEKPYFVARMGWRSAENARRLEEIALKRATDAEEKVKQLQAEKDNAWKERKAERFKQEEARLRNLQDPKHIHKRLRQAKKRRKNR